MRSKQEMLDWIEKKKKSTNRTSLYWKTKKNLIRHS